MKKIILFILGLFLYSGLFSAVEFMSFDAEIQDGNILLTWSTATETANQGFILERKTDSLAAWGPLTSYLDSDDLLGQGTVTYQTDYSYVDTTVVEQETYYYRISGVDEASNIGLLDSLWIAVGETSTKNILPDDFVLKCYPNPFNPSVVISMQHTIAGNVVINIYNTQGILVKEFVKGYFEAGKHEVIWNASRMPSGVYIVNMTAKDLIRTQKLILMK